MLQRAAHWLTPPIPRTEDWREAVSRRPCYYCSCPLWCCSYCLKRFLLHQACSSWSAQPLTFTEPHRLDVVPGPHLNFSRWTALCSVSLALQDSWGSSRWALSDQHSLYQLRRARDNLPLSCAPFKHEQPESRSTTSVLKYKVQKFSTSSLMFLAKNPKRRYLIKILATIFFFQKQVAKSPATCLFSGYSFNGIVQSCCPIKWKSVRGDATVAALQNWKKQKKHLYKLFSGVSFNHEEPGKADVHDFSVV